MNAVFKGSSVRRLWYRHLTVFTWEKASSLRWVDKNKKKKNLSKEELQIVLRRQINYDKDHKAAAIDCLAAPAVAHTKMQPTCSASPLLPKASQLFVSRGMNTNDASALK